jgi:hypothetical protein
METQKNSIKSNQIAMATNLEFYNSFFEMLKISKTEKEAFNRANDKHFETFEKYKYLSYECFITRHNGE